MSFDEFTYDRIEAYLNGEMSSEERTAFEKDLSTDQNLFEQVDQHKLANSLVLENRLLSVKDIFKQEHAKATQKSSYSKYVYAGIAAAVVIGTAVSVFMYSKTTTEEQQDTSSVTESVSQQSSYADIQTKERTAVVSSNTAAVQTVEPTYLRKQDVQLIEQQNKLNVPAVEKIVEKDTKTEVSPIQKTQQQPQEKTVNTIEPIKDLCADVVIKADIKTSATCLHESGGNVVVYNIQGGTKPYQISIVDAQKESVTNGALAKGIYQVYITDAKACEKIYPAVQISEKDCPKDYSFNPFIGEKWSIEPYAASGQLEIYNKGGVLYYKDNLDANSENEWTGAGFNNQFMPGYYIFVINYADGTNKKGSVTIVQ